MRKKQNRFKKTSLLALFLAFMLVLQTAQAVTVPAPAMEQGYPDNEIVYDLAPPEEDEGTEDEIPDEPSPQSPDDAAESGFILDPMIESHIRQHYNAAFTSLDDMRLINFMYVKNLVVDDDLRGNMSTIDGIMSDILRHPEVVVTQTVGAVPVFELSANSNYYVAFINTMLHDSSTQTLDYTFAILNNQGITVEGFYDFETGIAYIPRHVMHDEAGRYTLFEIQAQLLQSRAVAHSRFGEMLPLASSYFVTDAGRGGIARDGGVSRVSSQNLLTFTTTVQTERGLSPSSVSVVVNGLIVPSEMYHYAPATGVITLLQSSGSIFSIQVIHGDAPETGFVLPEATSIFTMPTHGSIQLTPGTTVGSSAMMQPRFMYTDGLGHLNVNNVAMYPNYTNADLGRLANDILNNGVNLDQLVVANRNLLLVMHLYFEEGHTYGDLFQVVEGNTHFWGVDFLVTSLICAHIMTSLGSIGSVPQNTFVQGGIGAFARVLALTDDYVLMGFVTQAANSQASLGVLRFERYDTPPEEGGLRIVKTSESGNVAGIQFRVTGPDGFDETMTTGTGGTIDLPGLQPGTYTVTEQNVGSEYEPQQSQTVTVVENQTATVTFHNTLRPGTLRIIKISESGNVAGIQFRITGGGVNQTVTTGVDGTIDVPNLRPGVVTVTEENIPPQYARPQAQTVTIRPNETTTVRFDNRLLRGSVSGLKVGEDAGQFADANGLAGAVIGIWPAGTTVFSEATALQVTTSGIGGVFRFDNLLYGDFLVRELTPPSAAYILNDTVFPVRIDRDGQVVEIRIENRLVRGDIEGIKVGEDTDGLLDGAFADADGLAGAVIGLFAENEENFSEETALYVAISDERGRFYFRNLVYGYYLVREISPGNDAYVLNDEIFPVRIDQDGQVIEIRIENRLARGRIEGIKTGETTYGLLAGLFADRDGVGGATIGLFGLAEFGIVQPDDEADEESDYPAEDDEEQEIKLIPTSDAEENDTDDDEQDDQDEDAPEKVVLSVNGTPLEDFEFTTENAIQTVITSEDGSFAFEDVIFGSWVVKEVYAPEGYTRNETLFLVTISEDGQVSKVEIDNTLIRGDIEGIKVGEDTEAPFNGMFTDGEGLAGAVIGLFRGDTETFTEADAVQVAVSDEQGHFTFRDVIFGPWIVREIATGNPAYILNNTSFPVQITEDGQVIEITIENTLARGSVEGIKVNAADADEALSGAVFGLFHGDETELVRGNALMIATSTADGSFSFADIPAGVFQLVELEAPEGFLLGDEVFEVIISEDGQIVEFVVENEPEEKDEEPEPTPTPTPNRPSTTAPKTGDDTSLPWLPLILAGAGILAIVAVLVKMRGKNKRS